MKKRTLTDILYDYALYFIIGILLLVIIAMERPLCGCLM